MRVDPAGVVDGDRQRRGRAVVFRCLDPGWHDGETESIGPDRRLRVRESLEQASDRDRLDKRSADHRRRDAKRR